MAPDQEWRRHAARRDAGRDEEVLVAMRRRARSRVDGDGGEPGARRLGLSGVLGKPGDGVELSRHDASGNGEQLAPVEEWRTDAHRRHGRFAASCLVEMPCCARSCVANEHREPSERERVSVLLRSDGFDHE
jgi:hypothetical protein